METIPALFKDSSPDVRSNAFDLLSGRPSLPTAIIEKLATMMEDADEDVQGITSRFLLFYRRYVPTAIVPIFTRLLECTRMEVRHRVILLLLLNWHLAGPLLDNFITVLLDNPHDSILQRHAAAILRNHLPKALVVLWQAQLEDENEKFFIRMNAARILKNRSNLPEKTIAAFATLAETKDSEVIKLAISAFGKQANFPRPAAESFAKLVRDADFDLRSNIVRYIASSNWDLLTSATPFGLLRDSKQPTGAPNPILPVPLDTEFLYGYLLYRSFREHLCLCVQGSELHIITQSTGFREDAFVLDRTLSEMSSARKKWWENWAKKHPIPTGEGFFRPENREPPGSASTSN